jgi:hypothetical protein
MRYNHEMFTLGYYRKKRSQQEIDEYRGLKRDNCSTAMCAVNEDDLR